MKQKLEQWVLRCAFHLSPLSATTWFKQLFLPYFGLKNRYPMTGRWFMNPNGSWAEKAIARLMSAVIIIFLLRPRLCFHKAT